MRVLSFVAAVTAGIASVCGGAEKEFVGLRVSCDRDGQFRWAIKMPSEYCVFCPDAGRTGGAFRLRSVPKAKDSVFHGAPAYPKNVYATVRVTMRMKGSAKGRAGFMPYDRSFHCGSEVMKPFEVRPGDGWKEFVFDYRPPTDGWYAVNVAHVAPFVIVGPDGDFLLDDVTVEFVDDPTRPSARPGTVKPKPREPTAAERAAAEKRRKELAALGDRIGGNETGDCMGPNAPKFAIARGSARQYGRPWRNYQTFYQWSFVDSRDSGGARCITDDPEILKPGCRVKRACYLSGPDIGHDYARQKAVYLEPFLAGCTIWSGEDNHSELVQRWDDETVGTDDPAVVALRDAKLQPSAMVLRHMHFYDEIALKRDRGVTVTPFAVIFDRASGYVPMYFYGNVWDFFAPTELEQTMWAFATHVYRPYGLNTYYTASPYGDVFDIVSNDASDDFLSSYPILMPIGDTRLNAAFAKRLVGCVERGATLVINAELLAKYPKALSESFLGLRLADATAQADTSYSRLSGCAVAEKKPFAYRKAEILPGTGVLALTADEAAAPLVTSHVVGRGRVIVTLPLNMKPKGAMTEMLALFDDLVGCLRREALPIRVSAPANVQHMINRSATSWIVYLNNVNGIAPATGAYAKPPVTDVSKSVHVKVGVPASLGKVAKAIEWWTGKDLPLHRGQKGVAVAVELPGGDCAAIEFVME